MISAAGADLAKEMEVELDADYNLHFRYVINAVGACTGKIGSDGKVVKFVEKIKFSPPKPQQNAG